MPAVLLLKLEQLKRGAAVATSRGTKDFRFEILLRRIPMADGDGGSSAGVVQYS
jgi:hypothetical protein